VRSDPGRVRELLYERDHAICAECGRQFDHNVQIEVWRIIRKTKALSPEYKMPAEWRAQYGPYYNIRSFWEADHIVPVSEGGGCCGLDGYRTLCRRCHNVETAELARRRARK
jgi:hypothetical protein